MDVLGFSDDILKNWSSQVSNPLEKILSIKRDMPIFEDIGEEDNKETRLTYVCRVNTVSDSVTICFGCNDNITVGDIVMGLESVLVNISYIWSMFIMNGYTIRGAIDFGDIYQNENDLIGPAFINAYRLESEVAKNSRILASPKVNKIFFNLVNKYDRSLSSLTTHLFQSFRKDVDGYIIVDPNIMYISDSERSNLIEELKKSRDAISSGIVKEKYNPLIGMLSEGKRMGLKASDVGSY